MHDGNNFLRKERFNVATEVSAKPRKTPTKTITTDNGLEKIDFLFTIMI